MIVLSTADRIALEAAYDHLVLLAAACPDAGIGRAVGALTPGTAAVAGVICFGGLVGYLNSPAPVIGPHIAGILQAACAAAGYADD